MADFFKKLGTGLAEAFQQKRTPEQIRGSYVKQKMPKEWRKVENEIGKLNKELSLISFNIEQGGYTLDDPRLKERLKQIYHKLNSYGGDFSALRNKAIEDFKSMIHVKIAYKISKELGRGVLSTDIQKQADSQVNEYMKKLGESDKSPLAGSFLE